MELPIEKQFQIMDALRRGFSIREVSQVYNVPKSTVQNYKKHGPPYFRRFKNILSIEQYPASLQEENEFLKKAIQEVLRQAEQTIDQRNTANKKVADLTVIKNLNESEIERQKQEKEQLQKTINEQSDFLLKIHQDHQQELENQKNNFTKYITKMEHDHQGALEEQKTTIIAAMEEKCKQDAQKFETERSIYEEQTKSLKAEIQTLKGEVTISFWKGVAVGAAGGGTAGVLGTLWYQKYISPRLNAPRPVIVDSETRPVYEIIPILKEIQSQSHIQYMNSGVTTEITPSLTLGSGAIFTHNGENTNIGYNTAPSQQEDMLQHDIQGNDRGVTPGTTISGILSSGAFSSGSSVFPNPQDGLMQSDTQGTSGDVTITYTSGTTPCSGFFCSSHLETGFAPQDQIPVHILSPYQIPINYYFFHLPSPLPDDLSEVYPMRQLRRLKGIPFEIYNEKRFIHKGCPTERTPYGDYSGDLIVTLNGVPTVIECKQKPIVRVDTIQRTRAAMEHYRYKGVTHCMVITTGEFTKDARDEAQNLGVELWDGKRLLEEIYKDQFFYVPEDESDYDPNK